MRYSHRGPMSTTPIGGSNVRGSFTRVLCGEAWLPGTVQQVHTLSTRWKHTHAFLVDGHTCGRSTLGGFTEARVSRRVHRRSGVLIGNDPRWRDRHALGRGISRAGTSNEEVSNCGLGGHGDSSEALDSFYWSTNMQAITVDGHGDRSEALDSFYR